MVDITFAGLCIVIKLHYPIGIAKWSTCRICTPNHKYKYSEIDTFRLCIVTVYSLFYYHFVKFRISLDVTCATYVTAKDILFFKHVFNYVRKYRIQYKTITLIRHCLLIYTIVLKFVDSLFMHVIIRIVLSTRIFNQRLFTRLLVSGYVNHNSVYSLLY